MNESDARNALMVRAYETAPPVRMDGHWSDDDRAWATRSALQVEGEHASADRFIARRARLAAERLCSRDRAAANALRALTWRGWIGWTVVVGALVAGLATDAIGAAQRINVLAPPMLAILAWNLVVYLVLAARATMRVAGSASREPGPIARHLARASHAVASSRKIQGFAEPLGRFARDWSHASAALTASRIARILHAAAAAFAAGGLFGMYVRGIAFEYRAGWESTFLDTSTVHALLSFVLGPASALSGIALPDEAALAAIRSSVSPGENAARWIHLYAITIALVVLAPRLLMALGHVLRERRLERSFPLSLDDGYFQSIARVHRGESARVHIVPYSYHPSPRATLGVNALMTQFFGESTEVGVAPTVAFGDEDTIDPAAIPGEATTLVAALFSLTATPERENHGVFVEELASRLPGSTPFAVLIDESSFRQRFDAPAAGGADRREERRAAWRRMLEASQREPVFVDLEHHDFGDAQRMLRETIDRAAARSAQD